MKNPAECFDAAVSSLSPWMKQTLLRLPDGIKENVCEVRLHRDGAVLLETGGKTVFLSTSGGLWNTPPADMLICSASELELCVRSLCAYSVHTHQQELCDGYIAVRGGHRAGICATAVYDGGHIVSVRDVSSVNLRIAHEVRGVAGILKPYINEGGLLIAGKPASGKTTLLRDLARSLSDGDFGKSRRVFIADERGEIGAVFEGIPQNNVGINTDVATGYSKNEAVLRGVRSMSPEVIICDEIGTREEAGALLSCLNCGVTVAASVHAASRKELVSRKWVAELLKSGVFENVVFLEERAKIAEVVKAGELIAENTGDAADLLGTGGSRNFVMSRTDRTAAGA